MKRPHLIFVPGIPMRTIGSGITRRADDLVVGSRVAL
jgi:hypothetical protein